MMVETSELSPKFLTIDCNKLSSDINNILTEYFTSINRPTISFILTENNCGGTINKKLKYWKH